MPRPHASGNLRAVTFARLRHFLSGRFALAVAAGLCLAAAFPKPGVAGLAWIAPALMALAALGRSGGEAFRLGYAAGLAYHLAAYYWLLLMPVTGLPILGWVALSMYLALFPAAWVWLLTPARPARSSPGRAAGPAAPLWGQLNADSPASWSWGSRSLWALFGAALWVGLELLRGWLISGFPWDPLGVSQYRLLPLIQVAAVTGVAGLSFVVVWTSLSLLLAGLAILRSPGPRATWAGDLLLPLAVLAALFVAGNQRLARPAPSAGELKIVCVQPAIPQTVIWDPGAASNRFTQLLGLSRRALAAKPDLIVWPEAALPSFDQESFVAITNLIRQHRVWMLFGADDAERVDGAPAAPRYEYFNSAFLFGPDARYLATYRKRKLVIFGEYVPLSRWLPFLKHFTPIEGGFTPGRRPGSFTLAHPRVKLCPLICFEDIFPAFVRRALDDDTDVIVNLTNNGWFGESAAQWQHAATAIFRAVENGLPLVRCANNGLTCWVDPRGRIQQTFTDARGTIYGPGFMSVTIPLPTRADEPPTFYRQHGQWFDWVCVAVAVAGAAGQWRARRASIGVSSWYARRGSNP